MSKTILAKVDGFTPIIDGVLAETKSITTALVFGRIWRFCQMKNGVCQATLEKIADGIGLSRQTVIDHIKILENAKYIEDITPDLRNRPHTYRDTGKAGLHIGISGVNDVDSAVNDVDSQSQPGLLEDSNKREVKKPENKLSNDKTPTDWLIAGGVSSEEIARLNAKEQAEKKVTDHYERKMGYNPLPWHSNKDLEALLRFLLDKSAEEITTFAEWSRKDFSPLSPAKARQYPRMVIECWPQAFADEPYRDPRMKEWHEDD